MAGMPSWINVLSPGDRAAYEDGHSKGQAHAAYVEAYGSDGDTEPIVPNRFMDDSAVMRWQQGWADGVEAHGREAFESEHFPELLDGELSRLELTGDERAVYAEVLTAEHESREISDACARVIANWFHGGQRSPGYAFVSTGAITDDGPSDLWQATGGRERDAQDPWMRTTLDAYGTYLVRRFNAGHAGPVAGWSALWIR